MLTGKKVDVYLKTFFKLTTIEPNTDSVKTLIGTACAIGSLIKQCFK